MGLHILSHRRTSYEIDNWYFARDPLFPSFLTAKVAQTQLMNIFELRDDNDEQQQQQQQQTTTRVKRNVFPFFFFFK